MIEAHQNPSCSLPNQTIQKDIFSLIFSHFSILPQITPKSLSKSGINGIMLAIFVFG